MREEWDPQLETGDPIVDGEHRRFFALSNEFEDGAGHDQAFLDRTVGELIDYSRHHFAHEEALMERFAYPYAEHHKSLHRDFAQEVESLGEDVMAGLTFSENGLRDFVKSWLEQHIEAEDRRLVDFLHAHRSPAE